MAMTPRLERGNDHPLDREFKRGHMTIQPIDKGSIHRLTSGQVITDLATAVKELVDNALDAKATTLDIRLSDYGSSLVEVSDNGHGIAPPDRPLLARKYHTSKLSRFEDLETLETLGFRGEALSSLCAVSRVSVVTKVASEACGVKLEYDEDGELTDEAMVARSVGTTMSVRDLFHSLPVRRKEFEKNLKRDYGRLVRLLQSYALICTGVRFLCTNQVGSGTRRVVVESALRAPRGVPSSGGVSWHGPTIAELKESARGILGKKIADGMLPVQRKDEALGVEVFGLVSGTGTGVAKGRGDGRHFYVNGRPIEFKKGGAILYESYKNFVSSTHTQRPACVLDVRLSPDRVDVNVTPDKRTVFFHEEAAICRFLQNCLVEVWEGARGAYTIKNVVGGVQEARDGRDIRDFRSSQLELSQAGTCLPPVTHESGKDSPMGVTMASASHGGDAMVQSGSGKVGGRRDGMFDPQSAGQVRDPSVRGAVGVEKMGPRQTSRVSFSQTLVPLKRKIDVETTPCETESETGEEVAHRNGRGTTVAVASRVVRPQRAAQSLLDFALKRDNGECILRGEREAPDGTRNDAMAKEDMEEEEGEKEEMEMEKDGEEEVEKEKEGEGMQVATPVGEQLRVQTEMGAALDIDGRHVSSEEPVEERAEELDEDRRAEGKAVRDQDIGMEGELADQEAPPDRTLAQPQIVPEEAVVLEDIAPAAAHVSSTQPNPTLHQKMDVADDVDERTLHIDMSSIREKFTERTRAEEARAAARSTSVFVAASVGATAAGAGDLQTRDTGNAEAELQRVFQKDQFKAMEVIGQFNRGFIVAKLGDDLFIIDQHASDEKHTFENLQRNTSFHKQRLICPIALEDLGPRDKEIVEDNRAVFANSGFEFDQDENGTLRLVSVPHCKGMTFNETDVLEMIGMIDRGERSLWHLEASGGGSSSQHAVYPSRFRALLASKACRTSIMIGKVLTKNKMTEILRNLSTLVSPWNCPHGRPTMRHLASLSFVASASKSR